MSEVFSLWGGAASFGGLNQTEQGFKWDPLRCALESILRYECWRLGRYLEIGDRARGSICKFGDATSLCFNDVGYFNRVYDFGAESVPMLPEILDSYSRCWGRAGRYGIELIARHGFELASVGDKLLEAGFRPGDLMVRLGLSLECEQPYMERGRRECLPGDGLNGFLRERDVRVAIRQPQLEEFDRVLDLYLEGFEAPRSNREGAKRNMMRLFEQPEFLTWCAFEAHGGSVCLPVALGMLYLTDGVAVLAAGVTGKEYRNRGLHEAMIQLRVAHAKSIGCRSIFTWTQYDGQSHRNLIASGFEELRVDQVWRREPF